MLNMIIHSSNTIFINIARCICKLKSFYLVPVDYNYNATTLLINLQRDQSFSHCKPFDLPAQARTSKSYRFIMWWYILVVQCTYGPTQEALCRVQSVKLHCIACPCSVLLCAKLSFLAELVIWLWAMVISPSGTDRQLLMKHIRHCAKQAMQLLWPVTDEAYKTVILLYTIYLWVPPI